METFFDLSYNLLEPHISVLEAKRQELKSRCLRDWVITIVIIALCIFFFSSDMSYLFLAIMIVSVIVLYIRNYRRSRRLNEYYKNDIIPRIVKSILPGGGYQPHDGVSEAAFCSCQLFPETPNRYSSEDFIFGQVDKTAICFSEVHAEQRHATSNGNRWVDIFKGFLFIADFHKEFSGKTVLLEDSWIKSDLSDEQRVKLENDEFERYFDVYSTDEIEARYILSPSMMERLIEMNYRLGYGVTVCFQQSLIYIAIPEEKNHFEASVWKPINHNNLEKEFLTIYSLIQIVDELNLNTRIWTKE